MLAFVDQSFEYTLGCCDIAVQGIGMAQIGVLCTFLVVLLPPPFQTILRPLKQLSRHDLSPSPVQMQLVFLVEVNLCWVSRPKLQHEDYYNWSLHPQAREERICQESCHYRLISSAKLEWKHQARTDLGLATFSTTTFLNSQPKITSSCVQNVQALLHWHKFRTLILSRRKN